MNAPTLILGGPPRIVVPFARSLWRRAIPVYLVLPEFDSVRVASRAIRRSFRLAGPKKLDALLDVIHREGADWVVPCSDTALVFMAAHYDELRSAARLACPPPAVLYRVVDKEQTMQAARECGVRVPASYRFADRQELAAARGALRFPLIAKPYSKEVNAAFKTRYYMDFESLDQEYGTDPEYGLRYMLQEYAHGEGVGVELLMDRGQPRLLFAHRRLQEYPSTGGVSVLAASDSLTSALVEASVRLLNHIGWDGVAMVEYRYDRSSGSATLMEINGRFWGSLALSIAAGVDFPFAAWQCAHGRLPEPSPNYPAIRARWTSGVFLRVDNLLDRKQDGLNRPSPWREMMACCNAFLPGVRDMLWSWQDPRPAIQEMTGVFAEIAKRRSKAIVRRMVPKSLLKRVKDYRSLEPLVSRCYFRQQVRHMLMPSRKSLPKSVRSLLFVCHGNIIRSPMAEALFRRSSSLECRSAGLYAKAGLGADERANRVAREFGVCLERHVATEVTAEIVASADVIFVMDALNEARFLSRFPRARGKLFLLGAFAPKALPYDEISDPYESSEQAVRDCFRNLETCIAEAVSEIRA